jgi:hypothetical protein
MTVPPPTIAQQYSSAAFVSLCFCSHKEKLGVTFKNAIIRFFNFFYKLRKQEKA